MPEDVSLDAFASDEGDDSDGEPADASSSPTAADRTDGEAEPDAAAEPADGSDVEPATATFEWSPDGGECADCGASVRRRWRDDGRLVCPDCKAW